MQAEHLGRRISDSPRASVCITNFNYGCFVGEAIESVVAQTYKDTEIVVVDDGSTDDSRAVLARFGDVATVVFQQNRGALHAALRAFEESTGDVVVFLDADDLLDADLVERVVLAFRDQPRAARVQWRLKVVDADRRPTGSTIPPVSWRMHEGHLVRHVIERRTYVWPPTSGNAFPRWALAELLRSVDPRTRWIDLFLAESSVLLGPVVSLSSTGGSYRWHGRNDSGQTREPAEELRRRIDDILVGHENLRRVAAAEGLTDVPECATRARDWAFCCYRLGLLKLRPIQHPLPDDRVLALVRAGITSVSTQPLLPWQARMKAVAWFAIMPFIPRRAVGGFLERTVLRPPVRVARFSRRASSEPAAS